MNKLLLTTKDGRKFKSIYYSQLGFYYNKIMEIVE